MKNDLTVYDGNLVIRDASDADKYAGLTKVTGDLSIYASAKLDALKSVGGDLSIYADAQLTAGKLYPGGYSKFKVYDGIGCAVLSSKQAHGVTVLACRHSKIKNQKVIGGKFYVAQQNGHSAHAKTIDEAVQELKFKLDNRDISKFKNMPSDTRKTPTEWAFVYRMVTGACQYGTQRFIESQGKLKKAYTLAEICEHTKGQFGHDRFVEVTGSAA